jgi:hypothetical protein
VDVPFLPPRELTWSGRYSVRHARAAHERAILREAGLERLAPPVDPPSPAELRWQAEDEWLMRQWRLVEYPLATSNPDELWVSTEPVNGGCAWLVLVGAAALVVAALFGSLLLVDWLV